MPDLTLIEATQIQCDWLIRNATRIQERGYSVVFSNANKEMLPEDLRFPFGYTTGGFTKLLEKWNDTRKTRFLQVFVILHDKSRMLDGGLQFQCNIPNRAWSRPIMVALELFGKKRRKHQLKNTGALFDITQLSDRYEVRGDNRAALESLLRILEMPQHRSLLFG